MGTKSINNKKDNSKSNLNKDLKKRKPKSETILKKEDSIDDICKLFRIRNEEIKLNNDFISAVIEGKIDEVKKLLKKGADINYTFSEVLDFGDSTLISYKTPLMYAIKYEHDDIFNFLIKKGADVLYVSPNTGNSALSMAIRHKRINMIDTLNKKIEEQLKNPSDEIISKQKLNKFLRSVESEDLTSIKNLHLDHKYLQVKQGFDVNGVYTHGEKIFTPLIYAVNQNKIEVVKLLIELGANVNLNIKESENFSKNVMEEALKIGSNYEIIKVLITEGAEITKPFELSKVCLRNDDFVTFNSFIQKSEFNKEELYELCEIAGERFNILLKESMEKSKDAFETIKIISDKLKSTFHFTI